MCVLGIRGGMINQQLDNFAVSLAEVFYHDAVLQFPTTWMDAFKQLTHAKKELLEKKLKIMLLCQQNVNPDTNNDNDNNSDVEINENQDENADQTSIPRFALKF